MTCATFDWCDQDHNADDPRDPEWHRKEATVNSGEIDLEFVLGIEAGKPYLYWSSAAEYDVPDVGDTTLLDLQAAILRMQNMYLEFAKAHSGATAEITPDAAWNANEAAEIVGVTTDNTKLCIFGTDGEIALDRDRSLALALATRLTIAASELREAPAPALKRHPSVTLALAERDV
ncbi:MULTISPECIES: hypothetical protein [unclassified Microbacterium]|uniref:hypothetical protein n=1 Tax=unclassified Microbacterium TaxID=2609290 RepID=UPI00214C325D|nr:MULTISPECIES: hypothetical protein [unclassified Microbacterium]MCR2784074.1 hypothetical protein [Microbacterium sp. zg.B96]MDL5351008.1 hypothetical protein [Microbacterium sp. zg-YB36]WIM15086.1 hypothetical protein QNO11_11080 [Microbacterium sp. zg-B96]